MVRPTSFIRVADRLFRKSGAMLLPLMLGLASCAQPMLPPSPERTAMGTDITLHLAQQEKTGLTFVAVNSGTMPGLLGPVTVSVTRGGCEGAFKIDPPPQKKTLKPGEVRVVRYQIGQRVHLQPPDCPRPDSPTGFAYGTASVTTFDYEGTTSTHDFEIRTRRDGSRWFLEDVTYRRGSAALTPDNG